MLRMSRSAGLALATLLAAVGTAQGEMIFTAALDGAQSGSGSPGVGYGTVTLNDAETQIDVELEWSGLIGDQTLQHIHGPAAPGNNAGVVFTLPNGSPVAQSYAITAEQVQWLKGDLLYFNVHTTTAPGGEIRGQITPEPATVSLLAVGAAALLRRR